MPDPAPREEILRDAHRALRARFGDFRQALERRDETAYRVALADFQANLRRWTSALEETLLPALMRPAVPRKDLSREMRLDFVQLRELTRHIGEQFDARAPLADILGMVENLGRRLDGHGVQIDQVYAPAAAEALDPAGWKALEAARPSV